MSKQLKVVSWVRITDSVVSGSDENMSLELDKQSLTSIYRKLKIDHPKFFKMDTQCKLGFVGSYLLLREIREELSQNDEAISLLFANASSSLTTDRHYQETVGDAGTGSPAKFVYTLPNIVIGEVCIYWKQLGETQFLVLPEFNAETLLDHAHIMDAVGDSGYVLVGWTEVENEQLDGLFVLLSKNEGELATVNDLSQLYSK